jgi:hypothetical protein
MAASSLGTDDDRRLCFHGNIVWNIAPLVSDTTWRMSPLRTSATSRAVPMPGMRRNESQICSCPASRLVRARGPNRRTQTAPDAAPCATNAHSAVNRRARSGEFKRNFKIWRIGRSHEGGSDGDRGDGTYRTPVTVLIEPESSQSPDRCQ